MGTTPLLSREIARRVLTLILLCFGLAVVPVAGVWTSSVILIAALAVYLAIPRAARPDSALTYDLVPAVYGPDTVGFLLTGVFFALPFWARMGEPHLWRDFGVLVHPSALLAWPLTLIAAAILWFSAQYASFWLVIEDGDLRIGRLGAVRFVPFSSIVEVRPMRRGLPRWFRWLTPMLIASGKFGAAGALLLARDTTGVTLVLDDDSEISIPQDAFEKHMRRVISALRKNGVVFAPDGTG